MKTTTLNADTITKLEADQKRRNENSKYKYALKTMPKPGDVSHKLKVEWIESSPSVRGKPGKVTVHCICKCGGRKQIKINSWRTGRAKSCGCSGVGPSAPKRKELIVVTTVDVSEAATAVAYMRLAQSVRWVIAA